MNTEIIASLRAHQLERSEALAVLHNYLPHIVKRFFGSLPLPALSLTVTIRFSQRAFGKTRAALFKDDREAACFLFAHILETRQRTILLLDYVVTLDESCYLKRTRTSVVVHHHAKNPKPPF